MFISHAKKVLLFSWPNLLRETLWKLDRPASNILVSLSASSDISSWHCAMQILSCFQGFLVCPCKSFVIQMQSHDCTCGVDFFLFLYVIYHIFLSWEYLNVPWLSFPFNYKYFYAFILKHCLFIYNLICRF